MPRQGDPREKLREIASKMRVELFEEYEWLKSTPSVTTAHGILARIIASSVSGPEEFVEKLVDVLAAFAPRNNTTRIELRRAEGPCLCGYPKAFVLNISSGGEPWHTMKACPVGLLFYKALQYGNRTLAIVPADCPVEGVTVGRYKVTSNPDVCPGIIVFSKDGQPRKTEHIEKLIS